MKFENGLPESWKNILRVDEKAESKFLHKKNSFHSTFLSRYNAYFFYDFRSYSFFFLSDYCKNQMGMEYHENEKFVCLPFHNCMHPHDLSVMKNQGLRRLFSDIEEINPASLENLRFEFTYRIKTSPKKTSHILQNLYFVEVNGKGGALIAMGTLSNISHHADKFFSGDNFYSHSVLLRNKKNEFNHFSTFVPVTNQQDFHTFTLRQRQILQLLSEGLSSKMIGEKLNISRHTVDTHRRNMLEKMNMNSSAQLVRFALENGMI